MTYSEKLRDPRWQKKRLEVLEARKWTCEDCGDTKTELQIHHCFYAKGRDPWEYNNNTLMCLCKPCHENRQGLEDSFKGFMAIFCRFSSIDEIIQAHAVLYRMLKGCPKVRLDGPLVFHIEDDPETYQDFQ